MLCYHWEVLSTIIRLDSLVLNWFLHSLCHVLNYEMGTGVDIASQKAYL